MFVIAPAGIIARSRVAPPGAISATRSILAAVHVPWSG
jgi:hypothetical protein